MVELFTDSLILSLELFIAIVIVEVVMKLVINIIVQLLLLVFNQKAVNILLNNITFVGTMHHELSHAIFVILTGAKLKSVELFKPQQDRLGRVTYATRGNKVLKSLQCTMISIAPTLMGIIDSYLLYVYVIPICSETWQTVLAYCTIASLLLQSTMSKQDIKNAKSGIILSYIAVSIVIFIVKLFTGI